MSERNDNSMENVATSEPRCIVKKTIFAIHLKMTCWNKQAGGRLENNHMRYRDGIREKGIGILSLYGTSERFDQSLRLFRRVVVEQEATSVAKPEFERVRNEGLLRVGGQAADVLDRNRDQDVVWFLPEKNRFSTSTLALVWTC